MMFRKPLTLISDEMQVPSSIVDGTSPRQPPKIVIHSSNRPRSDASFQADAGSSFDDVETSTRAMFSASVAQGWLSRVHRLGQHLEGVTERAVGLAYPPALTRKPGECRVGRSGSVPGRLQLV